MPEPITLTTLLIAGANLVGTETVKEVTKDAYRKLKEKVGEVFGSRASTAVAKLENPATHEQGRKDLARCVDDDLRPDEATELAPFAEALVRAMQADAVAKTAVHSRVGLDIEAGGNAFIRDIQGAREIVAKVKAGQDVTIEGLHLDTGRDPGK
jgi:ribosomal protein L29